MYRLSQFFGFSKKSKSNSLSTSQIKEIEDLRSFFINRNIDLPNSKDDLKVFLRILNTSLVDNPNIKSDLLDVEQRYIFITCKLSFLYIDFYAWERFRTNNIIPRNSQFYNFSKLEKFLNTTKIDMFLQYMSLILKSKDLYKFKGFKEITTFLNENKYFIDNIPDAVLVLLYNLKTELLGKEEKIIEICDLLNIGSLSQERLIIGLKWLATLNKNSSHAPIILKLLKTESQIEQIIQGMIIKNEDYSEGMLISVEILKILSKDGEREFPLFYNLFIKFINNNKLGWYIFRYRSFFITILNCERLFSPKVLEGRRYDYKDVSQFTTIGNINEHFIQLLINTQEEFSIGFFYSIEEVISNFSRVIQDAEDEMEYELKATYQLGQKYFVKQVEEFMKKYINLKLSFTKYLSLISIFPFLKNYHHLITKDSINEFLNKVDLDPDIIEAWENMWKFQNPTIPPPPPPDWFIKEYDFSNVHNKTVIKVTDCRLKLLSENFKDNGLTIDDIADKIEKETKRIATLGSKTEHHLSDEEKLEYVKNNTVTKKELFVCRIDSKNPRYYGYGEIYDNKQASKLSEDKRVELCNVLVQVWIVIQSTEGTPEMYSTLITQFTRMFKEHLNNGVCNQGWVGSLTSVFGAYVSELGYLCQTEDKKNEKVEVLINKFLIDMKSDAEVEWPTIHSLFSKISGILLDAKYDDEWREHLEEEMKMAQTPEEEEVVKNKIKSFEEKIQMYDILFEPTDDVSSQTRKETMIKFVNKMKPTFFMDAYTYFTNEDVINIKKAVNKAFMEFTEFQLNKIR